MILMMFLMNCFVSRLFEEFSFIEIYRILKVVSLVVVFVPHRFYIFYVETVKKCNKPLQGFTRKVAHLVP